MKVRRTSSRWRSALGPLRSLRTPALRHACIGAARPGRAGAAASLRRPSLRSGCPALLAPRGDCDHSAVPLDAALHRAFSPVRRIRPGPPQDAAGLRQAQSLRRQALCPDSAPAALRCSAPHRRRRTRPPRPWGSAGLCLPECTAAPGKAMGEAGGAPVRRRGAQGRADSDAPQARRWRGLAELRAGSRAARPREGEFRSHLPGPSTAGDPARRAGRRSEAPTALPTGLRAPMSACRLRGESRRPALGRKKNFSSGRHLVSATFAARSWQTAHDHASRVARRMVESTR